MNKIELCNLIENYINGIDTDFSVDVAKCTDELDAYFYRTAIRIKKAFDIYKKDACYINDFLIALRDFLLVFETDLEISSVEIPANNDYAIKKNETTGKYFEYPRGTHVMILSGYDGTKVATVDPYNGNGVLEFSKSVFKSRWELLGRQGIILVKN